MERNNLRFEARPGRLLDSSIADPLGEAIAFRQTVEGAFDPAGAEMVRRALDAATQLIHGHSDVSVRVARLLVEQHADAVVTAAVLLSPLRAREVVSRSDIERDYGADVAALVEQANRISPLRTDTAAHQHDDCAALLRSTAADLRLLTARIAVRIIDLESPSSSDEGELRLLAREGRELLVPLADRIGLGVMRGRLEDACFRILEPDVYHSIEQAAAPIREADGVCLDLVTAKVAGLLEHNGIDAEVQGRTKSLWGIYRKMRQRDLPVERIMDRLGARVIVAAVPECYTVLGILHRHFRPIPGTFSDYIGLPKENGYQSLQTCVYPLREISAKPVELQIRTRAMHAEAEFGAAAHWLYKSREEGAAESERQRRWLEELASCHAAALDHASFLAQLERLAFDQSLVVFLRGGEQIRMPRGSTAADLVNKLSERSAAARTVRINSNERPLSTPLADGDTVEWNEEVPRYLRPRAPRDLSVPGDDTMVGSRPAASLGAAS